MCIRDSGQAMPVLTSFFEWNAGLRTKINGNMISVVVPIGTFYQMCIRDSYNIEPLVTFAVIKGLHATKKM